MFSDSNPKLTGTPDLSELEHLALSGQMELLHDFFRKIPEEDRYAFAGKYILHAVVRGGIAKLRKLRAISSEIEVSDQISFLHKLFKLFFIKFK